MQKMETGATLPSFAFAFLSVLPVVHFEIACCPRRGYSQWSAPGRTGGSITKGGVDMLTLLGARQTFCDGITRRGFLQIGAFGAGLTLAEMLRARALGAGSSTSQKSAIMIYLPGGPSHMDM